MREFRFGDLGFEPFNICIPMDRRWPLTLSILSIVIATTCFARPAKSDEPGSGNLLTRSELNADLDEMMDWIRNTHPDLNRVVSSEDLSNAIERVRRTLPEAVDQRGAWVALSVLNPVFNDAHTGISYPREAFDAHMENGGKPFPLGVDITEDRRLIVKAVSGAAPDVPDGAEILSINGEDVGAILTNLLPRMRGEGPALHAFVLSLRFPGFFWTFYGPQDEYRLRVRDRGGEERDVTITERFVPSTTARVPQDPFDYTSLAPGIGHMRLDSFRIELKDRFASFLTDVMPQIFEAGISDLVIDIRNNGGGAHDVSDLLVAHLIDKPVSYTSTITARITEENIDQLPGAPLGSIATVPFPQWIEPVEDEAQRFKGNVYVLISPRTYSQAIAFAVTLQDAGFARIAGQETEGPANQSGQVQRHALSNSGLEALAPIYILVRASGVQDGRGVVPDIALPGAGDSLEALITEIKK